MMPMLLLPSGRSPAAPAAHARRCARWLALPACAAAVLLVPAFHSHAQTAEDLFTRALVREEAARADRAPSLDTLRAVATAYENVVRRFPRSGYSDNALWQAAGLLRLAYARHGKAADREKAASLLVWLRREYPASTLARREPPEPRVGSAEPAESSANTAAAAAAAPTPPAASPPGQNAPLPPGGGAAVRAISHASLPRGDRITIELTLEVPYTAERLGNPDRVYVDLTHTTISLALIDQAAAAISGRLVKNTRIGIHPNGTSRVVLDVTGKPRYSTFPLYNPFRLVIDIESDEIDPAALRAAPVTRLEAPPPTPTTTAAVPPVVATPAAVTGPAASPAGSAGSSVSARDTADSAVPASKAPAPPPPAAPAVTSRGDYSLARQLGLRISRVVIDPGHGGHDPGAQANGLSEAELVLDVARRLEELLREEGLQVVLTRRGDTFVPLEERTAIANREEADLFISIHANASPRSSTAGIETYFLNFATNQQAEAIAARENASSSKTMGNLPTLLKAIALNNKLAESRELAGMVQSALVRSLSTSRRGIRSLGVKQAPFVVLIGAQMPSVLAEVGFITNRPEAAGLKQPAGRQAVADGLFQAILKYQAALKSDGAVASTRPGR
jgi:N-acetylmuramoyl-L-alanine amidase